MESQVCVDVLPINLFVTWSTQFSHTPKNVGSTPCMTWWRSQKSRGERTCCHGWSERCMSSAHLCNHSIRGDTGQMGARRCWWFLQQIVSSGILVPWTPTRLHVLDDDPVLSIGDSSLHDASRRPTKPTAACPEPAVAGAKSAVARRKWTARGHWLWCRMMKR